MLPSLSHAAVGTCRATSRRSILATQKCFYHSHEHKQPPPFAAAESAILSAAYSHVPNHGFSTAALRLGARDAGYLDVSTNLFPRGAFDLINYHLVTQRLALQDLEQLSWDVEQGKALGISAKVRILTLARLRANEPVIHQWQEALAVMAQPSYAPASIAELARLADEIWYLAGDSSVDTDWYTKRATLSAMYSATEVFMTQDTSKDFRDTEQFLDGRLQDVMKSAKFFKTLGDWVDYTGHSAINVLRSKGMRI